MTAALALNKKLRHNTAKDDLKMSVGTAHIPAMPRMPAKAIFDLVFICKFQMRKIGKVARVKSQSVAAML